MQCVKNDAPRPRRSSAIRVRIAPGPAADLDDDAPDAPDATRATCPDEAGYGYGV